jgi:hypothetical protein
VAFIGSAALLGFLAARFLKSSAERRHPSSHQSSPPQGGTVGPYTDTMAPSPGEGAMVAASEHDGHGTTRSYRGN